MPLPLPATYRDTLAVQLLTVVFSIYFLVTLTVTLIHVLAEVRDTRGRILHDLEGYSDAFRPGVTHALWGMDRIQIDSTLEGMLKISSIVGVRVTDEKGRVVSAKGTAVDPAAGGPEDSNLFGHKSALVYTGEEVERPERLGTLDIYSSRGVVVDRVKLGVTFILVNAMIKTAALWLIFVVVSRRMLSRPLSSLTASAERMSMDSLEETRVDLRGGGENELKTLARAFNLMLERLALERRRMISLRRFASKIAEFSDEGQILRFGYEELQLHSACSAAALMRHPGGDRFMSTEAHPGAQSWLGASPSLKLLEHVFSDPARTVETFKWVGGDHPLRAHYRERSGHDAAGGHFILARTEGFRPHLLVLHRPAAEGPFHASDAEYVVSMLREMRAAQDNVRAIRETSRMESELRTAAAVQSSLFPKTLPTPRGIELACHFQSATETGGDWYGFMRRFPGHLFLLIGDVTGHGTPAALVTATASSAFRIMEDVFLESRPAEDPPTPAECMRHLNEAVYDAGHPKFLMTFFIARIDLRTGETVYCNAGHNFPFLARADGSVRHLLNANPRLGDRMGQRFVESRVTLERGDLLFLYTDGLVENENHKGASIGERGLLRLIRARRHLPAAEMLTEIVAHAHDFYGATPLGDDVTAVACAITEAFPDPAAGGADGAEGIDGGNAGDGSGTGGGGV